MRVLLLALACVCSVAHAEGKWTPARVAALPSPKKRLPSRWRRLQANVDRLRASGVTVDLHEVPMSHGPEARMTMSAHGNVLSAYISYATDATLAHELQHLSDRSHGTKRTVLQSEVAANYAATGDVDKAVEVSADAHPEVAQEIKAAREKYGTGRALFRAIIRGR